MKPRLYPLAKIYSSGYLEVSDIHTIYFELSGNWNKPTALLIHGGPGSSISRWAKKLFNPKRWNILQYDQRGCGESTPLGELRENTMMHLVEDIKKLLKHLGIKKVMLYGPSWGSTVAMAFALKYPTMVSGIVLQAVFLGTKAEEDYLYYGAAKFYPEAQNALAKAVPSNERRDLTKAYYKRVMSKNRKVALKFALLHRVYEFVLYTFTPFKKKRLLSKGDPIAAARLMLQYALHGNFLPEGYILKNASRLRKPVSIVHGRYDTLTPPIAAWKLHKEIKGSRLFIEDMAGHSRSDRPNYERLLEEIKLMERKV